MSNHSNHWTAFCLMGTALASAVVFASAAGAVEPTVQGPIPGHVALNLGQFKVEDLGYVVEEFFISGTADSYSVKSLPSDGRWVAEKSATAPYATRLVVVRPASAARFNGTAVVEWLNVSLGADTPADWYMVHRELIRDGYTYIGVSAQKVGVDGGKTALLGEGHPLAKLDPERYGRLSHPGDAFSFDIFSQAGRSIHRKDVKLLGPLVANHIIAIGESQSAGYLVPYVNAVAPLNKIFDGFFIHSRGAAGAVAQLTGGKTDNIPSAITIRTDLSVPVMTFITETDLIGFNAGGGYVHARQPDSMKIRTWELAGSSHADNYIWQVAAIDDGKQSVEKLAAAWNPMTDLLGTHVDIPINAAPQHHYVLEAAIVALNRWVTEGKAPPTAHLLEVSGDPAGLVLDTTGNAKGGVRTPWEDVPTAKYSGVVKSDSPLVRLSGTTQSFDHDKLTVLYPGGRGDYLAKFAKSLDDSVKAGFILKADVPEIRELAAERYQK
jgi:hypothetical protein